MHIVLVLSYSSTGLRAHACMIRQDVFRGRHIHPRPEMTTLARHLRAWVTAAPRSLQDLTQMTVQRVKELSMALVV